MPKSRSLSPSFRESSSCTLCRSACTRFVCPRYLVSNFCKSDNRQNPTSADWPVIMHFKGAAAALSCFIDHRPVLLQSMEKSDHASDIPGFDPPSTGVSLENQCWGRVLGTHIEHWTSRRHYPVRLARDDGPYRLGPLRHESDVPFCRTPAQVTTTGIRSKLNIGDISLFAELLQLRAPRSAPDKDEAKAVIAPKLEHRLGDGVEFVGKS